MFAFQQDGQMGLRATLFKKINKKIYLTGLVKVQSKIQEESEARLEQNKKFKTFCIQFSLVWAMFQRREKQNISALKFPKLEDKT